jgi:hypothetical protein
MELRTRGYHAATNRARAFAVRADRASFAAALHDETELGAAWIEAFFDLDGQTSPQTTERLIS